MVPETSGWSVYFSIFTIISDTNNIIETSPPMELIK